MYQKLLHQPSTAKHEQPFSIRLNPTPRDECVAYINSVCAALIDSRFEMGRSRNMVFDLGECLGRGAIDIDALAGDSPVPWYASFLDRATHCPGNMTDTVLYEPVNTGPSSGPPRGQPLLPSNLGRGSPNQPLRSLRPLGVFA